MKRPQMAVTGANGMLGHHICRHFLARDWDVRALVRDPSKLPASLGCVAVHRFDLPIHVEPESLEGVRVLVHPAAPVTSTAMVSSVWPTC